MGGARKRQYKRSSITYQINNLGRSDEWVKSCNCVFVRVSAPLRSYLGLSFARFPFSCESWIYGSRIQSVPVAPLSCPRPVESASVALFAS